MYYPSLEEIKGLAEQGNLVPVYRRIQADLETPVSAYLKVARSPYSFLLESVGGRGAAGSLPALSVPSPIRLSRRDRVNPGARWIR